MMIKATKKPVEIEAIQLTKNNTAEVLAFVGDGAHEVADGVEITTLEGAMLASWGDYVIKGVKGEFYPCKPDIFEATYDVGEVKPRLRGKWVEAQGVHTLKVGGLTIVVKSGEQGTIIETTGKSTDPIGQCLEDTLCGFSVSDETTDKIIECIDRLAQQLIDDFMSVIEL